MPFPFENLEIHGFQEVLGLVKIQSKTRAIREFLRMAADRGTNIYRISEWHSDCELPNRGTARSCLNQYLIRGGIIMSPRFYGFLWVLCWVSAGIIWLAGVFTMLAAVGFGFIAFGLVFVGMMCVLPAHVSHPAAKRVKLSGVARQPRDAQEKHHEAASNPIHFPAHMRFH